MSFLKSLFVWKTPKKLKRTYDKAGLTQIYEEAKELFLRGKHDQALEGFKSIYEHDALFRDVAIIVEESYDMPKGKFMAKYKAQFRAQVPKQTGEMPKESGEGGDADDLGSAPVPVPKRPITPSGSFRAERRPDEGDRTT